MSGTSNEEIDVSVTDVEIAEDNRNEVVNALRSQLEYYFSFENLSKDTFLCSIMSSSRTESEQRSGREHGRHAPIVMLARFGKVKKIVNNIDAIEVEHFLEQAALSSDKLEVVALNGSQLLAIGPKDGLPLPYESQFCAADPLPPLPKALRDTIILREIPESATQQQVQDVFSWDGCPTVKSVHPDVGYCWFVTFQATEDEVVSVLLKLRSMQFEGQPIKARLKPQSSVKPAYTPDNVEPKNKNRSKSNNRNGRNRYSNNRNRPTKSPKAKAAPMPPPQFHETNFPSLNSDKLSSEKPSEELKENNAVITGYAAALLKTGNAKLSPPPTVQKQPSVTKPTDRISKSKILKIQDDGSNRTATTDEKSSISSQSDTIDAPAAIAWSGKKSFADVLKKEVVK